MRRPAAVAAGGLDPEWNAQLSAALILMRFARALLRHIPEPSIRLFLVLAIFGAVVVTSFAMLDSSGP